ncbi:MAG TPA: nucleotide exchange factor GrpE [Anaerolineales bacterium]|nr:nucleotide exchange factor GrpE [Anaerolineales bacterium]
MTSETVSNQDQTEMAEANDTLAQEEVETVAETLSEEQALRDELNDWQAKANEYLDGWQRARAEFANYKKRVEREQAQVYQSAAGNVIKRYLEILDDLERALKNRPAEGDGAAWANGIELISRKLATILEVEGVTPMQAEGQFFDPNMHEAISQEDNPDYESGQVIEVVKQGYLLGERVLRPAQVRLAK